MYINLTDSQDSIMVENFKAVVIITNHFKEQPVFPKIVYANKYLLNSIGYNLQEIADKDPSAIFANWNNDEFISEIVTCVDRKVSWVGDLQVKDKNNKTQTKKFTITPIFNPFGEILYYSCTTEVSAKQCKTNSDGNLICLDDFVNALWEHQAVFKDTYEMAPENLLKIDVDGNITFINKQANESLSLNLGDNLFKIVKDASIKKAFKDKNTIGKVTKINFDIKTMPVSCKFWPLDQDGKIIGYSISISDITRKRNVAKELLALKGA